MVSVETVKELALSFEETIAEPHFDKTAFKVRKKIFATLDVDKKQVVLKLSRVDQSVFAAFDHTIIYPVPGGWGAKGWTIIELRRVRKNMFVDALTTAYCGVAPKKFAEKYRTA